MQSPALLVIHQEITLKVNTRLLSNKTSITISSEPDNTDSITWAIDLEHVDTTLRIAVGWRHGSNYAAHPYRSLSLIPWRAPRTAHHTLLNGDECLEPFQMISCDVAAEAVTNGNKYSFDIILSTNQDAKAKPRVTCSLLNNEHEVNIAQPAAPPAPTHLAHTPTPSKHRDTVALLLKDICSADIFFSFPVDKILPNAVLCAHRFIISPYRILTMPISPKKGVLSLTEERFFIPNPNGNDGWSAHGFGCVVAPDKCASNLSGMISDVLSRTGATLVKIGNISLATFCSLLYYLYTGEIDLEPVTSRFAMFRFPSRCNNKVPLWIDQPLVLETTWEELLKAWILFEIPDLQTLCRENAITWINKDNAIMTLFGESAKNNPRVKKMALTIAVQNMDAIFASEKDPFVVYKDHPDYHEVLMELMRLKVKSI